MNNLIRSPLLVFAFSFFTMLLSALIGISFQKKQLLEEDVRKDLDLVVSATLTLLGLIIGFSFSMAISRYDQRKNYEEAEANAIGTEYFRAELLPAANAAKVRALLSDYLDERILFYETRDQNALQRINANDSQLQTQLWAEIQAPAAAQPTPMLALVVSG